MDNSISALQVRPDGEHFISIDLIPQEMAGGMDSRGSYILRVEDTGMGMNLQQLRAWATLGEITDIHDAHKALYFHDAKTASSGDKFLTGTLGRFGVGGKHAAFQLASSVTIATRPFGAPFVYEATLDAAVLSGPKQSSSINTGASSEQHKVKYRRFT